MITIKQLRAEKREKKKRKLKRKEASLATQKKKMQIAREYQGDVKKLLKLK